MLGQASSDEAKQDMDYQAGKRKEGDHGGDEERVAIGKHIGLAAYLRAEQRHPLSLQERAVTDDLAIGG